MKTTRTNPTKPPRYGVRTVIRGSNRKRMTPRVNTSPKQRLWGYRLLAVVSSPLVIVWAGVLAGITMHYAGIDTGFSVYLATVVTATFIDQFLWERGHTIFELKEAVRE